MKKVYCVIVVLFLSFFISCCSYKGMDKVLFVTAVLVDTGEDENAYDIYFEAFRPSSSRSEEKAEGEKIVYGIKNKSIGEGMDEMLTLANLPLSFAQTKVLLFTKAAAEKGLDNHVNLFLHADDFTIRTFIAIWDDTPEKFEELELLGEKYMGIYLRTHIQNAEKTTSHVKVQTMLDLKNAAQIKGKILLLSIIKPVMSGKTQLIDIPEVALLQEYKMVGTMSAQDSDIINYLNGQIKQSNIETYNPDEKQAKILLSTLSGTAKTKITPKDGRMKIVKNISVKLLFRGSQKHISLDEETIKKIKKQLIKLGDDRVSSIYKEYYGRKLDVFNLGEAIYRKYPWFDQENLYDKIDLTVKFSIKIEGSNNKMGFNPKLKHN